MRKKQRFFWQLLTQNKYFRFFLAIITVFLAFQYTYAQDATVLKLEQAIELALKVDNDVVVAGNDLTKAQLAVDLAKINTLPSASGDADVNDYFGEADNSRNLQLKVEQTIPTKWHLYGADTATEVETKRWAVTKSEAALRTARAETVNDVTNLYYSALKTQKTLDYQRLAVDYAREKADYNKLQLQYGKVTKTTQLTAENDFTTARYELAKAQQAYRLALQKLASQIGITDYQQITLDQTLPAAAPAPAKSDYEKQKQLALLTRPEIKQYQMELKTAAQELAVAKNSGLPSLDLSFQNRGELQSFDAQYDFLSGDLSWSTAWQKSYSGADDETMENFNSEDMFGNKRKKIALTLSWELDFGSAANETKQAFYAVESAKRNLEQSSKDIALEIDAAISDYEAALAVLDNSKAGVPLYEKTLELSKLQAKMGMMTAVALKKAELDLASARADVATAACDLLIAAQKLKLTLGLLYDIQ
jgi:outer membrane protein TolC